MAYEIPGQRISVRWGTTTPATTTNQYTMFTLSTAGYAINPGTTADARPFGILQDVPPSTASAGSFLINGVSKIKAAGSTLGRGDMFACSTAGLAVPVSTDHQRLGYVLDGTSSTGTHLITGVFYGPLGAES